MPEILNGKDYVRKLINIAFLNIGVPLLFFAWVYLESTAETLVPKVAENYIMMLFVPVGMISLALIIFGHKKYKQLIKMARDVASLSNKLNIYQKATTQRFVSYSISSLLISLGFYLTDFQPFAALFGIMIVLFSMNNPNARKVVVDLHLKDENKKVIIEGLDLPKT